MAKTPKVPVLGADGKKSREETLDASVFSAELKPHLVHEAVRADLNSHRSGSHAVKSRGLVAGGRAKPWRQKGTGRARQGTIRAPHFTGGGVAFATRQRFDVKVNRKAYRAALRAALSNHAENGTLALLDGSALGDEPSTKAARALVEAWGKELPLVVVASPDEEVLAKSFRNLDRVSVVPPSELEVAALVWARSLLVSEAALDTVQRRAS